MKMSELILAVGDENVRFQNLLNDAASIDKTKSGTKITFYTDGVSAEEMLAGPDKSRTDGDVVEHYRAALEQAAVALGDAAARMDGWSIQGSRAASNAEDAARAALSALGIGRV